MDEDAVTLFHHLVGTHGDGHFNFGDIPFLPGAFVQPNPAIINPFIAISFYPPEAFKNNIQANPKIVLIVATLIYGVSYGALVFGFGLIRLPEIGPVLAGFRRIRIRFGLAPASGQPEIPTSNT